jgi:hydroxypyruvate reductase/glycerate 2-kinase
MNNQELAKHIFIAGIKGVMPDVIIGNILSMKGDVLKVGYLDYDLRQVKNLWVIGAGKASAAMAHFVESILGNRITGGHIITKYGCFCRLKRIRVTEAGHPVPDENSFQATREILKIADEAGENDLVICLWSGGGSSLLADYPETSSPEEIQMLNDMLVKSGADIKEMNSIRKHLSNVKGGQLARHISPARSVCLILSDVIGDPFDVVSSGPTVPDNSTYTDALNVLEKYSLSYSIPQGLYEYLKQGKDGMRPETPKTGDPAFTSSVSVLAGNNRTALLAAKAEAEMQGLSTFIITSELTGDTGQACSFIVDSVHNYRNNPSLRKPLCLIFGGETTVKVTGSGKGGRNQHLVLTALTRLKDISGITFLSAGTDGNDGNTEMAGAVVDSDTLHFALSMNADPEKYLGEFDSYNFFREAGGHVFTGPTLTNVMDIAVAIIE